MKTAFALASIVLLSCACTKRHVVDPYSVQDAELAAAIAVTVPIAAFERKCDTYYSSISAMKQKAEGRVPESEWHLMSTMYQDGMKILVVECKSIPGNCTNIDSSNLIVQCLLIQGDKVINIIQYELPASTSQVSKEM
jgi:hypothetical protein